MTERACQTCGAPIVEKRNTRRKFCSERCRKAQYDLVCVDCGRRVDGTTPSRRGSRDPRCNPCSVRHVIKVGRADMARAREKREHIAALWVEGMTMGAIARDLGYSLDHLGVEMVRMRRMGYDLPYRYKAYERKQAA